MSIETILDEARALPLEDLSALSTALAEVLRDAETAAAAPAVLDNLVRARGDAAGRRVGDPWVQPMSAVDAYPTGAVVTHAGKTWRCLTPACVWEPGVSGWREVPADEATPAAWVQPTGAHDAYAAGDRVSYAGAAWVSRQDANVWAPDELVHTWDREGTLPDAAEPAEPAATAPAAWFQPTGAQDAYKTGDVVTFDGHTWRSLINANTWSPAVYPAGWARTD